MIRMISLAMILVVPALPVRAGEAVPYQATTDRFFELLAGGKPIEAIDFIFSTNPFSARIADSVQAQKARFMGLESFIGKYLSHKKLLDVDMGDMYAYQLYIVAFERQPMSFKFKYYKPKDTWVTQSFVFGYDIDRIIEDLAVRQPLRIAPKPE